MAENHGVGRDHDLIDASEGKLRYNSHRCADPGQEQLQRSTQRNFLINGGTGRHHRGEVQPLSVVFSTRVTDQESDRELEGWFRGQRQRD